MKTEECQFRTTIKILWKRTAKALSCVKKLYTKHRHKRKTARIFNYQMELDLESKIFDNNCFSVLVCCHEA